LIGLTGLWLLSLALAGGALLIMLGLIVGRWWGRRRSRATEAERRRLIPMLLGSGDAPRMQAASVSSDLMADLAVELIQMVRGEDRRKLVATATEAGVPRRLLARLRRPASQTRIVAAEALAEFPSPEHVEALEVALRDRNQDVRLAAAMSLAATGNAPPARRLIEQLHIGRGQSSLLVVALLEDIALERPQEIRSLIEDPAIPEAVKAAAIEALSSSGDYSLVPIITDLAIRATPTSEALPRFLRSLGQFGHPAAGAAVERGLRNGSADVRAAACEAAGKIGLVTAAEKLAQLLGDESWWVRFRAGEALTRIGPRGHRLLSEAASSGDRSVAQAAELIMAERGIAGD